MEQDDDDREIYENSDSVIFNRLLQNNTLYRPPQQPGNQHQPPFSQNKPPGNQSQPPFNPPPHQFNQHYQTISDDEERNEDDENDDDFSEDEYEFSEDDTEVTDYPEQRSGSVVTNEFQVNSEDDSCPLPPPPSWKKLPPSFDKQVTQPPPPSWKQGNTQPEEEEDDDYMEPLPGPANTGRPTATLPGNLPPLPPFPNNPPIARQFPQPVPGNRSPILTPRGSVLAPPGPRLGLQDPPSGPRGPPWRPRGPVQAPQVPGLRGPVPTPQGPGFRGPGLRGPVPAPQGLGLRGPVPAPQGPGLRGPVPAPQGRGFRGPVPAPQGRGLRGPVPAPQGPGLRGPVPAPQGPGPLGPPQIPRGTLPGPRGSAFPPRGPAPVPGPPGWPQVSIPGKQPPPAVPNFGTQSSSGGGGGGSGGQGWRPKQPIPGFHSGPATHSGQVGGGGSEGRDEGGRFSPPTQHFSPGKNDQDQHTYEIVEVSPHSGNGPESTQPNPPGDVGPDQKPPVLPPRNPGDTRDCSARGKQAQRPPVHLPSHKPQEDAGNDDSSFPPDRSPAAPPARPSPAPFLKPNRPQFSPGGGVNPFKPGSGPSPNPDGPPTLKQRLPNLPPPPGGRTPPPKEKFPKVPPTKNYPVPNELAPNLPGGLGVGHIVNLSDKEAITLTPLLHSLLKQPYFHLITRARCNSLLATADEGMFLIRPSTRSQETLTLSHRHNNRPYHINIRERHDGLFALGIEKVKEMTFTSVEELVSTHQQEAIKLKNGERTILTTSPPKDPEHIYIGIPPLKKK